MVRCRLLRLSALAPAVAALALLAWPRAALGVTCAETRPFLAPADGSVLPPNPVVYLFSPFEPILPHVVVDGVPVEVTPELIGENRRYRVYALGIAAPPGSDEVVIELGPGRAARYQIDPGWQRPEAGSVWVGVSRRPWASGFGVAESHLALHAQVAAPAFRVSIGSTPDADATTVIVPGLGAGSRFIHLDPLGVCEGVFAPGEPGQYARVAALFADGEESAAAGPVKLTATGWSDRARALTLLFTAALLFCGILLAPGANRPRSAH